MASTTSEPREDSAGGPAGPIPGDVANGFSKLSADAPEFNFSGGAASTETPWEDEMAEMPDFHDLGLHLPVLTATSAVYHADVATKNAARLAQLVQDLWITAGQLHQKVCELEEWKKGAMEDVRQLREEQKLLRRRALGEDAAPTEDRQPGALRSKSVPAFPPGLCDPAIMPLRDSFASAGDAALEAARSILRSDTSGPLVSSPHSAASVTLRQQSQDSLYTDGLSQSSLQRSISDITRESDGKEGVTVNAKTLDGVEYVSAEWRIAQLQARLKTCMGRYVVSSPFKAAGLEDVRLMVSVEDKDLGLGSRGTKKQKEVYIQKVTEGPLEGKLSLKVPNSPPGLELQYYLQVGAQRRGPFRHNFLETTVSGCDNFGADWLKELEPDQSLTVRLDIVKDPAWPEVH